MKFRHELKYEINYSDLLSLRMRLAHLMEKDPYAAIVSPKTGMGSAAGGAGSNPAAGLLSISGGAGSNPAAGTYQVKSLYFDTPGDTALRDKQNSVNIREKFRIRYYNDDLDFIRLEKKSKREGLCNKQSCRLTASEVARIIAGDCDFLGNDSRALCVELYCKMRSQGLAPKTIVEYTREPYIYRPGNVRITLDSNIRTGDYRTDFLNPDCITVPIIPSPIILEIKWDEFLPEFIRAAVAIPDRRAGAFSKYAQGRFLG